MKKLIALFVIFSLISCEKEGDVLSTNNNSVGTNAVISHTGSFLPTSGISASGNINIYLENGMNILELKNVSISGGPDLKVYLSKSDTPNDFVNLGNYSNGTNLYKIPSSVILSQYTHVLVHCQQYNHLFAIAQIKSK
jgi:Electron transfer DM13